MQCNAINARGADLSESESDGCWDVQYLEGDIFFVCTVLCRQLEFSSEVQAGKQLKALLTGTVLLLILTDHHIYIISSPFIAYLHCIASQENPAATWT